MGKLIQSIFGGGKKPKVGTAAQEGLEASKKKAKKSRATVLATKGGIAGEELTPEQVQTGKETLFGN